MHFERKVMKKIRNNTLIKNFAGPMVVGLLIGWVCAIYQMEVPVRILYTISEIFVQILLFVAPFMVFVYMVSGINQIRGGAKKFFIKFFLLIFSTLGFITISTLILSHLVVPHILVDISSSSDIFLEPYFELNLKPLFGTFEAILMGIMLGLFIKPDSKTIELIHEGEEWISNFAVGFLLPIMPIWIIGVFAQSTYVSSSGSLFINDIILSAFILAIQFAWLFIMYLIASIISKKSFKKIIKAGLGLYVKVTAILGMGTGIIVPFAIDAQKKVGVDEATAKIVSVSSLNMPGSIISNIVFAYGIIVMYNIDVTTIEMLTYSLLLILATMIAPAVPGGVFSVTSTLLTPILGFSPDQIATMGALYYKQGTSNSATNNAADLYIGPLMDSNRKF
jgi:Na+/H+-dicarboxylate symporter